MRLQPCSLVQRLRLNSVGRFGAFLRALDFCGKLSRHPVVAHFRRQHLALLQDFDRARYLALGKEIAGLAEDLGITMTFFCWSHATRNRNR